QSARPPCHVRGRLRGVLAGRRRPGTLGLEILARAWTHRPEPTALDRGRMLRWAVFVALNPFMTAHPPGHLPAELRAIAELSAWQRFRFLFEHRGQVSSDQQ